MAILADWQAYFNSRPSARGDPCWEAIKGGSKIFQFTPLREGRLYRRMHKARGVYFNSRPSARGDLNFVYSTQVFTFQFTPLREGRPGGRGFLFARLKFQFTPLREGRPPCSGDWWRSAYFNSRPSARGDRDAFGYSPILTHFNSRPSARGDRDAFGYSPILTHFNSRPSARGDSSGFSNIWHLLFQFTPLREGRRQLISLNGFSVFISIHAPPRGATSGV